jgi:hypothetical protein
MRIYVLVSILIGNLLSSVGALDTHALATLDAVQHTQLEHDDAHGHSHGDDLLAHYEGTSHSHLGADHSHDKAHALPATRVAVAAPAPDWKPRSAIWTEQLTAHRLDRPPKAA